MTTEVERSIMPNLSLCPHLRWKAQFFVGDPSQSEPPPTDGYFWCIFTQTCIGPDGRLADSENCSVAARACYGTGVGKGS